MCLGDKVWTAVIIMLKRTKLLYITMAWVTFFSFMFSLFTYSDAVKCFNCQAIPFPHDCAHLTECNSNEYCFTEQVVTLGGNVVYNTGCLGKEFCSEVSSIIIGKRSENTSRRATDISTCFECCSDSFCNMKGCGDPEIPVDQRGPYCYNCDTIIDPKTCEKAAICLQNEICLLYTPTELRGAPEKLYRSKCGTQSTCDKMSAELHVSGNQCSVTCCSTDFCNDACAVPENSSMTTKNPITTTESKVTVKETTMMPSTHLPSSTKSPFHCYHDGGYISIRNDHAELCIHIVFLHATWDDARSACKKTGGDLLVLDTLYKTLLMKQVLTNSHEYYKHSMYWIGGKDYSTQNNFQWINNQSLENSVSDWAKGEPTGHTSNEQECIVIARDWSDDRHFYWYDKRCHEAHSYICEQK